MQSTSNSKRTPPTSAAKKSSKLLAHARHKKSESMSIQGMAARPQGSPSSFPFARPTKKSFQYLDNKKASPSFSKSSYLRTNPAPKTTGASLQSSINGGSHYTKYSVKRYTKPLDRTLHQRTKSEALSSGFPVHFL